MGNFLGDRNVLYLDGVIVMQMYTSVQLLGYILKRVAFFVFKFSLDKVDLTKTLPGKSPWKPSLRTTGLQFPKTCLHHFSLGLALTIRVRIFSSS